MIVIETKKYDLLLQEPNFQAFFWLELEDQGVYAIVIRLRKYVSKFQIIGS